MRKVKPTLVDILLESYDGEYFLFDIKTAKPNKGGFKEFKRTLLEWTAVILAENPNAKVNTIIAIPYNSYNQILTVVGQWQECQIQKTREKQQTNFGILLVDKGLTKIYQIALNVLELN